MVSVFISGVVSLIIGVYIYIFVFILFIFFESDCFFMVLWFYSGEVGYSYWFCYVKF